MIILCIIYNLIYTIVIIIYLKYFMKNVIFKIFFQKKSTQFFKYNYKFKIDLNNLIINFKNYIFSGIKKYIIIIKYNYVGC